MCARRGGGRKGSEELTRTLLALLGALDSEGDTITADAVASRLGISREKALRHIEMLCTVTNEQGTYLPLYISDDGSEVTLAFDGELRGRPCRLTVAETRAIAHALDRIGLATDDPTRVALRSSFSANPADDGDVSRFLAGDGGPEETEAISVCAQALLDGVALSFPYRGVEDPMPRRRTVEPERLRHSGSHWYLDGYDLDRGGERSFRLDRMGTPSVTDALPPSLEPREPVERDVELRFADRTYLDVLDWPDLHDLHEDDGVLVGSIPYYGGEWLVRRIAACGGSVTTDDFALAAQVRVWAMRTLDEL